MHCIEEGLQCTQPVSVSMQLRCTTCTFSYHTDSEQVHQQTGMWHSTVPQDVVPEC